MVSTMKISPSVVATRQRAHVGASLPGGIACAAGILHVDGTSVSADAMDLLGVRPEYVPAVQQAFRAGDRVWSPPD